MDEPKTERWVLEQALQLQKRRDRIDQRERAAIAKLTARYAKERLDCFDSYPEQVRRLVDEARGT
jgi:hypothetical protein